MQPGLPICFPPFQLDIVNKKLWCGSRQIPLRPKTFDVLDYLVEKAEQLVSKEELLTAVWSDTCVSEAGLKDYIQEIRKALGDDPRAPRFIETVQRRGYRFIGKISSQLSGATIQTEACESQGQASNPLFVDREATLAHLQRRWEQALRGARQMVFVVGEAGIGKTAVVEAFLQRCTAAGDLWIARGQCVAHHGRGEAYLPVLDALDRLCRAPGGDRLIALLSCYAPSWLVQMPWLLSDGEHERLQRKVLGVTRKRMLREMVGAVEALTTEKELILVLEDLQGSDGPTLDLLSFLARRREPARLLLLGTYRPVDIIVGGHPLNGIKQELQMHGQCDELPLELMTVEDVGTYLTARFPASSLSPELAWIVHRQTEGNPLFVVTMGDYLAAQGKLSGSIRDTQHVMPLLEGMEGWISRNIQPMIEQQIRRLSTEERRVLEAASVAGVEFSVAAVAAGLQVGVEQVEEWCADLARRGHFLRARGEDVWPDHTIATRYDFIHTLYQQVFYNRLPAGRRAHLHQRISQWSEAAYGHKEP